MNKFILFIIVILLFNTKLRGSRTEIEGLVVIIYPHFFYNTRTLISKVDSIINFNHTEKEFFIYLSNEFTPSTYYDRELLFDFMDKLSFSYGNLVPDYSFDIEGILNNEIYKKIIDDQRISTISYAFFIPKEFCNYLSARNKRKSLNNISYNFGIIPKRICDKGKDIIINLYFPKDTTYVNIPTIENVQVNFNEI